MKTVEVQKDKSKKKGGLLRSIFSEIFCTPTSKETKLYIPSPIVWAGRPQPPAEYDAMMTLVEKAIESRREGDVKGERAALGLVQKLADGITICQLDAK